MIAVCTIYVTCTYGLGSCLMVPFRFGPASFNVTMSNNREVAHVLNSLVHILFGSCDNHALSKFVNKYHFRDDPIDGDSE